MKKNVTTYLTKLKYLLMDHSITDKNWMQRTCLRKLTSSLHECLNQHCTLQKKRNMDCLMPQKIGLLLKLKKSKMTCSWGWGWGGGLGVP